MSCSNCTHLHEEHNECCSRRGGVERKRYGISRIGPSFVNEANRRQIIATLREAECSWIYGSHNDYEVLDCGKEILAEISSSLFQNKVLII